MVNVPQGNFEIGDGTSVATFNSITITAASQSGGLTAATIGGGAVAVPAAFPMGYNAFYCMKYEISQEQYVEFLNSLTYDQQKTRTINDPIGAAGTYAFTNGNRNGIRISVPGNNSALPAIYACDATAGVENNANDGQNVAANWLSWGDLTGYLDWAALRPMSEMEYEKVCRGAAPRVAGEYAWGTTAIVQVYNTLAGVVNDLTATESYSPAANGLCAYGINSSNAVYGPLRNGIFATGSSGRASAGASYYGAMEMGGNLYERTVTLGNATGATFTGIVGDGTIDVNGNANQTAWPSSTTAVGSNYRGGDYSDTAAMTRISDRNYNNTSSNARSYGNGGRGVR
jgi:formylglycine-generating enzyme required for sulfatase activity